MWFTEEVFATKVHSLQPFTIAKASSIVDAVSLRYASGLIPGKS